MSTRRIIVVTGANGLNGSMVARALKFQHDASVTTRLLVRNAAQHRDLAKFGEVVEGDFSDPDSLDAAFKGAHGLFLLTPFASGAAAQATNAVEAAKRANIQFLLRLSSLGANKASKLPVAKDHALVEDLVKASGLSYATLQPSFFMQNLLNYQRKSLEEEGVYYGCSGGKGAYGAIHAADTGEVAAKILSDVDQSKYAKKNFLLTGPAAVTDEQIAAYASKIWGKPIAYKDEPTEAFKQRLIRIGQTEFQAGCVAAFEQAKKAGMAKNVSSAVEDILGKKGRTWEKFLAENKL